MKTTRTTRTFEYMSQKSSICSRGSRRTGCSRYSKGFTLVEMLVSIFIFSMVMMIAVGSLLSMVDANRKAQTIKSAVNNMSFALDGISRSVRVGTNFHCASSADAVNAAALSTARNCSDSSGGTLLSFEAYNGDPSNTADQWVYCLGSGTSCSEGGTSILRSQNGGSTYQSITSPEVVIQDLHFYIAGALVGAMDRLQPKIVMVIHGYAGENERTRTEIRFQTTMTPRLLDE